MDQILDELRRHYKEWNRTWKQEKETRHEEWECQRSYADRGTLFEENLKNRIKWEKHKKRKEWEKYRIQIENTLFAPMSIKEKRSFYRHLIRLNKKRIQSLNKV
jgi:hypothetical protein